MSKRLRERVILLAFVCMWGGLYHATYINHRKLHISTRQGVSACVASFFLQQQRIFVSCKTALPAQDVVLPGAEQQGMKSDTFTGVAGVPLQTECGCKKGFSLHSRHFSTCLGTDLA